MLGECGEAQQLEVLLSDMGSLDPKKAVNALPSIMRKGFPARVPHDESDVLSPPTWVQVSGYVVVATLEQPTAYHMISLHNVCSTS